MLGSELAGAWGPRRRHRMSARREAERESRANLPDSQGRAPFRAISPERSGTGWRRQAQSSLMEDLTADN